MNIFVSGERFQKLERRVHELEEEVSSLKKQTTIQAKIPENLFWGFGPPPSVPVEEVVRQILDHLNMNIVYRPPEGPKFLLISRKLKKK